MFLNHDDLLLYSKRRSRTGSPLFKFRGSKIGAGFNFVLCLTRNFCGNWNLETRTMVRYRSCLF